MEKPILFRSLPSGTTVFLRHVAGTRRLLRTVATNTYGQSGHDLRFLS